MAMKSYRREILQLAVLALSLFARAYAQITPSGDSYTNTAAAPTNYGSKALLDVDGATQTPYIQLNLGSIPSGATVSRATLMLSGNGVTTAGSFNVDCVEQCLEREHHRRQQRTR
jgi:hypothetical protein